jgi:hypothetical protein
MLLCAVASHAVARIALSSVVQEQKLPERPKQERKKHSKSLEKQKPKGNPALRSTTIPSE